MALFEAVVIPPPVASQPPHSDALVGGEYDMEKFPTSTIAFHLYHPQEDRISPFQGLPPSHPLHFPCEHEASLSKMQRPMRQESEVVPSIRLIKLNEDTC